MNNSIALQAIGMAMSCFAKHQYNSSQLVNNPSSCRDVVNSLDIEIDSSLKNFFSDLSIPYCSEETNYNPEAFIDYDTWVLVDPLDGSLNYSSNLPDYGTSLTLLSKRIPIASAIGHPNLGVSIFACQDSLPTYSRKLSICLDDKIIQPMALAHGSLLSTVQKNHLFESVFSLEPSTFPGFHRIGSSVSCITKFLIGSYSSVLLYGCKLCDILAGIHICLLDPNIVVFSDSSLSVVYLCRKSILPYSNTLISTFKQSHSTFDQISNLSL